jgi:hypothetical protein
MGNSQGKPVDLDGEGQFCAPTSFESHFAEFNLLTAVVPRKQ